MRTFWTLEVNSKPAFKDTQWGQTIYIWLWFPIFGEILWFILKSCDSSQMNLIRAVARVQNIWFLSLLVPSKWENLALLSLCTFWGKCVYFSIFECKIHNYVKQNIIVNFIMYGLLGKAWRASLPIITWEGEFLYWLMKYWEINLLTERDNC